MDDSNGNTNQIVGVGPKGYRGATVYDKVEVTSSGHRFRVNDEAGKEEISQTHTTGSFERFGPSGGRDLVVVGHNYTAYLSGSQLVVQGACNITVMGDCNLNVGPKEDPDTGEKTGGNFKVEAENIILNSRKATEISAGTHMNLETRAPGEEGGEDGGDIGITSAGGYNLKVSGEATENIEKSLITKISKACDLTINGDYLIGVTGNKNEKGEGEYEGNMITKVGNKAAIVAQEKLKLFSNDKTIVAANNNIVIRSKEVGNIKLNSVNDITFNSDASTIFDSEDFTVNSGPVRVEETITAQGVIKSEDDVKAAKTPTDVSLKTHTHPQPNTGEDAIAQGDTLAPN